MSPEEETMGQRLKRLRQEKGLSQPALARLASVPIGTLRNWEQDRRVPLLDTAAAIARALGVSLDVLAGDLSPKGKESPSEPTPPPARPKRRRRGGPSEN
jgi:transcriptional regulator with XRE-family HTH domain